MNLPVQIFIPEPPHIKVQRQKMSVEIIYVHSSIHGKYTVKTAMKSEKKRIPFKEIVSIIRSVCVPPGNVVYRDLRK